MAAFVQRLRELNWIEGRTVTIKYRWAEGREQRYAEIAAEFIKLKVDVIVTSGAAVAATKQVTSVVPIVFGVANDPLTTGLVASLARPGGNVTVYFTPDKLLVLAGHDRGIWRAASSSVPLQSAAPRPGRHSSLVAEAGRRYARLTCTSEQSCRSERIANKVLEKLATSEKCTLVVARELDGKMRVTSGSWEGEKVFARGEVLEVRNVEGRLHVARKPRHHDDWDPPIGRTIRTVRGQKSAMTSAVTRGKSQR